MKSKIEQYIIDRVREKRELLGLSKESLSYKINRTSSFVGRVENPNDRAKYNFNHLNALAKALKCSPRDLVPPEPLD